jgi:antitoxin (DNA-binding transcriptional repressor) of toxin-antitoxin stability system
MKTINVHEAKTRLSVLLAEIERGGKGTVICRNGKPVADLVPHRAEVSMAPDRKLGAIKIKYDPTEEVSADDWPPDAR